MGELGRIEVRPDDQVAVVVLIGECDLADAPKLRECFDEIRDGVISRQVVLDLTDTTYIDSTVMSVILDAHSDGARFKIRGAAGAVLRLLEMSGFSDLMVFE